jgi:hypothetical protein
VSPLTRRRALALKVLQVHPGARSADIVTYTTGRLSSPMSEVLIDWLVEHDLAVHALEFDSSEKTYYATSQGLAALAEYERNQAPLPRVAGISRLLS